MPPLPHVVRALPVTSEQWSSYMDNDGRVRDVSMVKDAIFRGVCYSQTSLACHHWYLARLRRDGELMGGV